MSDCFHPVLTPAQLSGISTLGLAHIGDAVYELLVRTLLCERGFATAEQLHRETVRRVSAPAQAKAVEHLLPLLSEEDLAIYRRGRNVPSHTVPKHATHEQYGKATGLEALFGTLYLSGQGDRIGELFARIAEVL